MNEKEAKEKLEKLCELKDKITSLIDEFNYCARDVNCLERVGLISATLSAADFKGEVPDTAEDVDKILKSYTIDRPSIDMVSKSHWFPSKFDC